MSEEPQTTETDLITEEPEAISLSEFLESVPPSQTRKIADIAAARRDDQSDEIIFEVQSPKILIHCPHSDCNGPRLYRFVEKSNIQITPGACRPFYMDYRCSNCGVTKKIFSLMAKVDIEARVARHPIFGKNYPGECYKLGELPIYGPPTPSRLNSLIGAERKIFLKGRRCENQGLGIGAFVYYRRVVENQKARILDEIIKVSEKIGASPAMIEKLTKAKNEAQFQKAVKSIRDALPPALLINDQNPLTLLYSALSDGVHTQTDEHCLRIAHAVRVVLTELSDRLGQALKDEAELKNAISLLTKRSHDPSSKT